MNGTTARPTSRTASQIALAQGQNKSDRLLGEPPVILFGAFDRHNLGDLLFCHVAEALVGLRPVVFAGLAERDLRPFGGHRVAALTRLAAEWGEARADVVHVGGELLTCATYEAAVMLLPPGEARAAVARYDGDEPSRLAWAQALLGLHRGAAYVAPRDLFRRPGAFIFNAVGGVALGSLPFRQEVLAALGEADFVGVREAVTEAVLARAGIPARLMPDPAVLVAELFGERIAQQVGQGEVARLRQAFPQGWLAVQFSAALGDDATLRALASQLDHAAAAAGLGIVLFRAGAAPWHDDIEVYRRLAAFLRTPAVALFQSLDIWDICALIAASRAYCGTSLHGRVVATAFAVPRLNFVASGNLDVPTKQAAYAAAWEAAGLPGVVAIGGIGEGLAQALAADPEVMRQTAGRLCAAYRRAAGEWLALLGAGGRG